MRGRSEQRLDIDIERTEAHAQLVQRLAVGLLEMRDRTQDRLAREHAGRVRQHRRERADARGGCRISRGGGEFLERAQMALDLAVDPLLEARAKRGAAWRGQAVERACGVHGRLEQRAARSKAREDMIMPGDGQAAGVVDDERERLVWRFDQRRGAPVELVPEAALGGGQQQPFVGKAR